MPRLSNEFMAKVYKERCTKATLLLDAKNISLDWRDIVKAVYNEINTIIATEIVATPNPALSSMTFWYNLRTYGSWE